MKFGDMAFGDFPLQVNIDKQGLCPDGWYIPSVSEFQNFGTSDILDQEVYDRLNFSESIDVSNLKKLILKNFANLDTPYLSVDYLISSDKGASTNTYQIIKINSTRQVDGGDLSMQFGAKVRCIKPIDHKVYE
jgi:hypothetical protein